MISSRIINTPEGELKPWVVPTLADAASEHDAGEQPEISEEEILQLAKAQAFEQGYAAGMEQADEVIQAACSERNEQLDLLLQTLATPALKIDEQLEQDLVALILLVARQVVQVELKTNADAVHTLVSEALQKLPPNGSPVQLQLHPEDAALIAERIADQTLARPIDVVANDSIAKGGCLVSAGPTTVDAQAERIDELLQRQASESLAGSGVQ